MPEESREFRVLVTGQDGAYAVQADWAGGSVDPVPFRFEQTDDFLRDLEFVKWGIEPADKTLQEAMISVGSRLFDAVFPRRIIRRLEGARGPEGSLRLKLKIVPPELAVLPWEMVYDPEFAYYLAAQLSTPVARYVEGSTVPATTLTRAPRVLYVQANPEGTKTLQTAASEQAIREAYQDLDVVHHTTPDRLLAKLLGNYDILHYDGHGAVDRQLRQGVLYLHDEAGQKHDLDARELAAALDGKGLRLVVLAACETAKIEPQERIFAGIAQQLLQTARGMPAVVAMQFAIPDASAVAFVRGFYRALAAGYPVDAAVAEGRKVILLTGDKSFESPDWFTPVLFMHTTTGDILSATPDEETMTDPQESRPDPKVFDQGDQTVGRQVNVAGNVERLNMGDSKHVDKIDTYIEGNVSTEGGDFVVGSKHDYGDKISVGDISGSGIAVGRGASGRGETTTTSHTGDVYSGDFRGAILNVRSRLDNVSQHIGAMSAADDGTKRELQQLVENLRAALEQVPLSKAQNAEEVAEMTDGLLEAASADQPSKSIVRSLSQGLRSAAEGLVEVLPIVTSIVAIVGQLVG